MEDPAVRVTDSAEVMVKKIYDRLEFCRPAIHRQLHEAAKVHKSLLKRGDRSFSGLYCELQSELGEAEAELRMPRELIGDSAERRLLRAQIDACLQTRRPGFSPEGYEHPDLPKGTPIPRHEDLDALCQKVFPPSAREIEAKPLLSYQRLLAANAAVEAFIQELERLCNTYCSGKCGTRVPLKQCTHCLKWYCSDSCLHQHETLNQCL